MNFHQIRLFIRHHYTLNNIVIGVAVLIALAWTWNTVGALQNNFRLQRQVDSLSQEVERDTLQSQNAALENQYYASDEYLDLQARQHLNKATPGESVLILPANTAHDTTSAADTLANQAPPGNFQLWLNFFFGSKSS